MAIEVYLIGQTQFITESFCSFLADRNLLWKESRKATDAEKLVEVAGRICRMSFGKNQITRNNSEYIKNLVRKEHESVFEHAYWSFVLVGVSRSFTHQLVRHRLGVSFSQLSQEYYDHSSAEFAKPSLLKISPDAESAWQQAVQGSKEAYRRILKELRREKRNIPVASPKESVQRIIRSVARSVLPNATETIIVMTANARALRHFLIIRGLGSRSDEEMRIVTVKMLRILKESAPSLFYDFIVKTLPNGSEIVAQR